jgi:hypothetical protein
VARTVLPVESRGDLRHSQRTVDELRVAAEGKSLEALAEPAHEGR